MATLREDMAQRIATYRGKIEEMKMAREEVEKRAIQTMGEISGRITEAEATIRQFEEFMNRLPKEEPTPEAPPEITADVTS